MTAYSIDLRARIMAEVDKKSMRLNNIALLFKVNVKTIFRWRNQLKNTGSFAAKTNFQKSHECKIKDLELFKHFVEENSDLTLKEMAAKWGNVSSHTIHRTLKKINFSFKKNNSATKTAIQKKENNF